MTEEKNERKSVISKTIRRVYNVGRFESLDITVSYQEEVVWNSQDMKVGLEERSKKSEGITKLLLKDFNKTRTDVFNALNEVEKNAFIKDAIQEKKEDELAELERE